VPRASGSVTENHFTYINSIVSIATFLCVVSGWAHASRPYVRTVLGEPLTIRLVRFGVAEHVFSGTLPVFHQQNVHE